ncbi:MAG: hypothetical protein II748_03240, partial [Clostridia bacterium]|nr:hypothetical protein [Clostridia bacterium]
RNQNGMARSVHDRIQMIYVMMRAKRAQPRSGTHGMAQSVRDRIQMIDVTMRARTRKLSIICFLRSPAHFTCDKM